MNILCYSPYTLWQLQGLWETTLLHALRLRGHAIDYVLCDALYQACDLYRDRGQPRPETACNHCQQQVTFQMQRLQIPFHWLGPYLQAEDFERAANWAAGLEPEALATANYAEWKIGEWVQASVQLDFRRTFIDCTDPRVITCFRRYLESGLVAALGLDRLYHGLQPDVLLVYNGQLSSTRVALELARARGIRVVAHERGLAPESLRLIQSRRMSMGHELLQQSWQSWSRIPLLRHQIDALSGVMANGSQLYLPSDGPPDRREALCRQLAIDPDSSIWSLFPSADEQLLAEAARWQPYSNQLGWIEDSLDYVAGQTGLTLLILVPAGLETDGDKDDEQLDRRNELHQACYQALEQRLPANARLVWPDQGINPADLAEISDLGLALGSSAALEVALNGKACVVGAGHFLAETGFVRTLHARQEYPALLAELRPRQRPDPETTRQALRFAYLLHFRWNLPFPLVQMPDAETGRLAYTRLEQLGPGREPGLERACRIITGSEPEIAPPLSYDRQIGPEAELAWISALPQPLTQPSVTEHFASTPVWQDSPQNPRVSVVIPCYNHGHYLADAVHSILHQENGDVEILIVNDGSTDTTAEVCKHILAAYPERAIGVLHQANSGQPAIPWSRGLERARGEYFLCLSADDLLSPQTLGAYVDFLDRYPGFSLAYPRVYGFGDMHELIPPQPYDPLQLLRWNFIGGSPMYRRAAWEAAGGLATNVSSHEDWDLWIRFAETGHFGWQVDAATLYFRVHAGNLVQSEAVSRSRPQLKARLMLNHPALFSDRQLDWARRVLENDPASLALFPANAPMMPEFVGDALPPARLQMWRHWQSLPKPV